MITGARDNPAIETVRLHLESILPPEANSCQQCLERFEAVIQRISGITGVHFNPRRRVATVHFDSTQITRQGIVDIVSQKGASLGEQYIHQVVPIEGMDCADCAQTLEHGVSNLPGVEWASVNFAGARMSVEYDAGQTSTEAISRRVSSLGYSVSEPDAASPEFSIIPFVTEGKNLRTFIAAVLAIIGGAIHLSAAPVTVATPLYIAAILIAGVPIARKAIISAWTTRQLDINMLMTIAVIGASVLGEWVEAAAVVVLFSLGEALEGYTMSRARNSIRALINLTPSEAVVRRGLSEQRLLVDQIVPGDVVIVRPGERLPIDGIVEQGVSSINQAPVTGESLPVEKAIGADVFGGTINGAGVLEIRATRPASDSTIARIIRMVEDAQAQRAPTQRFVDVFARYYTPAVVALAATLAIAPPVLAGGSWETWIYRSLVLLVVACPCALVISTPVSIVSAISAAARNGVLIKGGAYLEAAGSLRALAFDKTGTLTQGQPRVVSISPSSGVTEEELVRYAAAAERYSEHPLGEAIVRRAAELRLDLSALVPTGTSTQTGKGIETTIGDEAIRVGTASFVLSGPADEGLQRDLADIEHRGETTVLVSVDGRVIGILGLADEPRAGALEALELVRQAGIRETVMLTGDRLPVATAIGSRLGVDRVEAELLPEQKVQAVERLGNEHGTVGMVGDGINDAPALARANVSFAMGAAGSDTALETADIALMSDDLSKVGFTIRLSRAARRIIMQNVTLSLLIKGIFVVLAVAGTATLWQAVLADVGAALVVIVNGMRLLRE